MTLASILRRLTWQTLQNAAYRAQLPKDAATRGPETGDMDVRRNQTWQRTLHSQYYRRSLKLMAHLAAPQPPRVLTPMQPQCLIHPHQPHPDSLDASPRRFTGPLVQYCLLLKLQTPVRLQHSRDRYDRATREGLQHSCWRASGEATAATTADDGRFHALAVVRTGTSLPGGSRVR